MIPYRNRVPNNLHCVGRKQLISLLSIVWKLTTCFYQMVYLCICEIFLKELRASYHQGGRTYMANYLLLLKWILPILQCEPIWFTLFVISIELSYKFYHYTNMKMCTNSFYHVHRTNVSIIPILWSYQFCFYGNFIITRILHQTWWLRTTDPVPSWKIFLNFRPVLDFRKYFSSFKLKSLNSAMFYWQVFVQIEPSKSVANYNIPA